MARYLWTLALCALMVAASATGDVVGKTGRYYGLKAAEVAKLPKAQRASWLTYLSRSAAARKADVDALMAERNDLPAIPPDAKEYGKQDSMPLQNPAAWYGSSEARHIADVIVSFQTPAGGWGKNQDFSKEPRAKGQMYTVVETAVLAHPEDYNNLDALSWHFVGTFDNDATITQMRFLAKVMAQGDGTDIAAWRASFLKGLRYIFKAELPCGGWPQGWPLEGSYHDALTFNDSAIPNIIGLLEDIAANADGQYGFVPPDLKANAEKSLKKARKIVLATQLVVNGKRTVWAQQYDPLTLKPVPARRFEPAMMTTGESAELLLVLMRLPTPSRSEIAAVHAGIAWLKSVAVPDLVWVKTDNGRKIATQAGAPVMWSRFYAPPGMTPVFADRDGTVHNDVNELSRERRDGYSWYNTGPAKALSRYETWSKKYPVN